MTKKREITNEERDSGITSERIFDTSNSKKDWCNTSHCLVHFAEKNGNGLQLFTITIGRPRTTTKSEDKFICVASKREKTKTAPDLREELNGMHDIPVSTSTVQRRLREYGTRSS